MPVSHKIESYPSAIKNFVERYSFVLRDSDGIIKEGFPPTEAIEIKMRDPKGAERTRFRIYGYLTACDKSGDELLRRQAKAFRSFYLISVRNAIEYSILCLAPRGQEPYCQDLEAFMENETRSKLASLPEGTVINPEDL